MKTKSILAGVTAAVLFASSTFAATPLPEGKAAGTRQAAFLAALGLPVFLGLAAATLAIVAAAGGFDNNTTTPSTGTGA